MAKGNPKPDLRIVNVSPLLSESIKNIAANKGVTQTLLLRKMMREIVDSYSSEYTGPPPKTRDTQIKKQTELRMTFIPDDVLEKLNNIGGNMWVSVNALLKMEVQKMVDKYPEHMKNPPIEY